MVQKKLAKGGVQYYLNDLPVSIASAEKRMEYVISIYDITKSSTLMCRISFRKSEDGKLWSKFLYSNPEYPWLETTKIFDTEDLISCNKYLDIELECHRYNRAMDARYIKRLDGPQRSYETFCNDLALFKDQGGLAELEKHQRVFSVGSPAYKWFKKRI